MKKYIKVKQNRYSDPQVAFFDHDKQIWHEVYPELYYPNVFERIAHDVFGMHFSFGQPYCVVCGKEQSKG